jgi:hypothetical protein
VALEKGSPHGHKIVLTGVGDEHVSFFIINSLE